MPDFEHILWKNSQKVKALFSLKNPDYQPEATLPGLNLGYNTAEPQKNTEQNLTDWLVFAGADPEKTALGRQIHKTHIETVKTGGWYADKDGFVTKTPGVSLGIFVADCGGILLADEKNGVIGACHAGWKGAVAGVVQKTVKAMLQSGAERSSIEAFISPCISTKKFEVGEEVATQFPEAFIDHSYAKPHVDLKGYIKDCLIKSGVQDKYITKAEGCTMSDAQSFYSYRREKDKSGRMMALITLKKD